MKLVLFFILVAYLVVSFGVTPNARAVRKSTTANKESIKYDVDNGSLEVVNFVDKIQLYKCVACGGNLEVQKKLSSCYNELPNNLKIIRKYCCNKYHGTDFCSKAEKGKIDFESICEYPTDAVKASDCFRDSLDEERKASPEAVKFKKCELRILNEHCNSPYRVAPEQYSLSDARNTDITNRSNNSKSTGSKRESYGKSIQRANKIENVKLGSIIENGSTPREFISKVTDTGNKTEIVKTRNKFKLVQRQRRQDFTQTTEESTEGTTGESTVETTVGSTEQTTIDSTEETTGESTEQTTIDSTEETTGESTEGTTVESTEETTVESTEETTGESTEGTTGESTAETTGESTAETTGESTEGTTVESTAETTVGSTEQTTGEFTEETTGETTRESTETTEESTETVSIPNIKCSFELNIKSGLVTIDCYGKHITIDLWRELKELSRPVEIRKPNKKYKLSLRRKCCKRRETGKVCKSGACKRPSIDCKPGKGCKLGKRCELIKRCELVESCKSGKCQIQKKGCKIIKKC